jgi:hypothetical protein
MTETRTIMVQAADHAWTLDALHCACQKARRSAAVIVLVSMIPVQHTAWLGTELGNRNFSPQDRRNLEDYESTILDYGLEHKIIRFQYVDFVDALADAADQYDAQIIFAKPPQSLIPVWRRFELWLLNRRLSGCQRQLIAQPAQLASVEMAPEVSLHETTYP